MSLEEARLCNDQLPGEAPSGELVACIEWNRVTIYKQQQAKPYEPTDKPPGNGNLTRGRFNGYMSPATRRAFKRTVGTWLRSMLLYRAEVKRKWDPGRAYPTFVTLTLPVQQLHTDREIYRACLMPWLQLMRREYGVEHYAWRAEAQENGNLHYHLILDRYVDRNALTYSWGMCMENLGYRSRYFAHSGSLMPPSTQVMHIVTEKKDKRTGQVKQVDPVSYMLDYLTDTPQEEKTSETDTCAEPRPRRLIGHYRLPNGDRVPYLTRPISGRVWGMSDSLRGLTEPKAPATRELLQVLKDATATGLLREVATEHATMYFGPVSVVLGRSSPAAWATVKEYYLQVFGALYPGQLPPEHLEKYPPKDPIGLWIDPANAALFYPPSHSERVDAWTRANRLPEGCHLDMRSRPCRVIAPARLSYRAARFARKRVRLNIPASQYYAVTLN